MSKYCKLLLLLSISVPIWFTCKPANTAEYIFEKDCYIRDKPNGVPIYPSDSCEIRAEGHQGYYFYTVRFSKRRVYKIQGNWEGGSFGKTPASSKLDNKPSIQFDHLQYLCWRKQKPFLEVCFTR